MPANEILFPAWWVRSKLSTVRNRCIYDLSVAKAETGDVGYSWSQCTEKACNKLRYRVQNKAANGADIAAEWVTLIAGLKSKLKGIYNIPYEWRSTEYRILERMNKNDFFRNPEIGCLWNFVAVSCANKVNDLMKVNRVRRRRECNESYNNVFGNFSQRKRHRGLQYDLNEESGWQKVLLANKDKIRSKWRSDDWGNRIGALKKKIAKKMSKFVASEND